MSTLAGAPRSNRVGSPTHFVREDGVTVVIYVGLSGDGSSAPVRKWVHSDLTALAQPPSPETQVLFKTAGYVRPSAIAAVIHGEVSLTELSLAPNGSWTRANYIQSSASAPTHPAALANGFCQRGWNIISDLLRRQRSYWRAGVHFRTMGSHKFIRRRRCTSCVCSPGSGTNGIRPG